VLVGNSVRKIPPGRLRRGWDDDVKKDFEEIGWENM
jgi:hypothetical protein